MVEHVPYPLAYSSRHDTVPLFEWLIGAAVAAVCFAIGHLVMELITQYLVKFHFFIDGMPQRTRELKARIWNEMLIEGCWVIPAALLVFVIQVAFSRRPSRGRDLFAGGAMGAAWCLIRWGFYFAVKKPFNYGAFRDFVFAMILAVALGGVLAAMRRQRGFHTAASSRGE